MKKKVVFVMVMFLLSLMSVSFAVSTGWAAQEGRMVSQDTPRVELFVTSWCPYCKKAIDFFQSKGIPVTVYDIEQDAAAARRKDQLDSRRGVPFAVINGQHIHGYSADAYQRALDRR